MSGDHRALTPGERAALSPGLAEALDLAGARPSVAARAALPARIAAIWRGAVPILTWGQAIHWPDALADFTGRPRDLAILQHELQHVLEFATGALTAPGYLLRPRNWTYRYDAAPDARWSDFGAEQRAQIVEDYFREQHAIGRGKASLAWYEGVIPWARKPAESPAKIASTAALDRKGPRE